MRKTTKSITHGALTAAITVVLILVDRVFVGLFMSFIPLPLIVYGLYYTVKESLVTYLVTVFLVMMVFGQLPITILTIVYGFVGLVYIAVFKTEINKIIKFLAVFFGLMVAYVIMILFFGAFFGMDIFSTMMELQSILKVNDPQILKVGAYLILMLTVALETFVIFMSATLITQSMKQHRK